MAFVPASRMADHPNHWWTSKIRGKCAGKRPGKARELALAKPNLRSFSMANVFNAKVNEIWYMLARFNVEKLNNENQKSILHPPLHGVTANKICYSTRKTILLVIFSISRLGQCPGTCKKRFFDCCNLDRRLARTWYNPSNELKGESVAGTLLAETAEPGRTDLAKAWNPAEPSRTQRSGRTQRNPAEPGETRRNPAEPGGTRRNPAEPGGTWRNLAEEK